jgi:hypothetical protein
MAPAASVLQAAQHMHRSVRSAGIHLTVRARDRQRALAIAEMHRKTPEREQWWNAIAS